MEKGLMNRRLWPKLAQVATLVAVLSVPGVAVLPTLQDQGETNQAPAVEQPPGEEVLGGAPEEAEPEADVEVTEIERILRIERVTVLDRQRLAEIEQDLVEKNEVIDVLGKAVREMEDELAGLKAELEELGPTGDPEARGSLGERIESLQTDLDLYKTQVELEYGSAKIYNDQIAALEKKLEREQRTLDSLMKKGGDEPSRPTARAPVAEEAAGTGVPAIPLMPGMMPGVAAPRATPEAPRVEPETADQIAARREVERRRKEVWQAEEALVEFVKRKESLELQIELEGNLLRMAEGSRANLERALVTYQGDLETKLAEGAKESVLRQLESSVTDLSGHLESATGELEERTAYLASLEERLPALEPEKATLTRALRKARDREESALRASLWLESPIHPVNMMRWIRERGPRMLMVLLATAVVLILLRLTVTPAARLAVGRGRGRRSSEGTNRADTLAFSFRSAFTMLIIIGGVLLIFQEAGVDIKTVLGGAAILGVAIAFGAQNLMRDYFTGFMILLEDQYELGDLVTINDITGLVEKVNMRTTVLRDLEGRVHFLPNGNINAVTNRTYEWGRAVLEVPVGYKEDVDRVMEVLLEVVEEFRSDPEYEGWVTDVPVMLGVDKFTEYGVVIKFMVQTQPDKIFPTRRQLLRRVKNKFDEQGIEISVPHRILLRPPDDSESHS